MLTANTGSHIPWGKRPVMWDMTHFDFESMNSDTIHSFMSKESSMEGRRIGSKTAFLAGSDHGFGMKRMLEQTTESVSQRPLRVFRGKDEALEWLRR